MDIENFILELEANGRSKSTIKGYREVLKRLNTFKSLDKITKPDLMRFFKEFAGTDETKRLYQAKIKKFFTDTGKEDLVSWIKLITIKESLVAEDILTTDDVNTLIEATDNLYMKAWISLAFESGARFNEIERLKWKDFKETTDGLIVTIPTSKNDALRPAILLAGSGNYIRNFKAHSMTNENDSIFPLTRQGTANHLDIIKEKAKIEKQVTPHKFRHAQACDMVKRNYTEAIIKSKMGWKKNSNMSSRYIHLDNQAVIDATLRNGGKVMEHKPITEIKQADKITLVEAAGQFLKLSEENKELKEMLESHSDEIGILKRDHDFELMAMDSNIKEMKRQQISFFKIMGKQYKDQTGTEITDDLLNSMMEKK